MVQRHLYNSHPAAKGWLFFYRLLLLLCLSLPLVSLAHPSPNTLIFLDVNPNKVRMEVQLPVPELELAFGQPLSKEPERIIERYGPQLKEYLLAHIHAYSRKDQPWQVMVTGLKMDKGTYEGTNALYWEVNASVTLAPPDGESTRRFYLDYDAVLHQVMNHAALVSIRSDWEGGLLEAGNTDVRAIGWDLEKNIVPPLEVTLEEGSWRKGFISLFGLGMQHIKEGTDHLLFLITLLLPAMLLTNGKRWLGYGGLRYSLSHLVKIVTAFTIGHSVTLLTGALGWLRLPGQPVEILIAVSILVSAVHAIRPIFPGKEVYIAAGFGLIHGLAFATVLSNLELSAGRLALSILGFNLGIEVMQLFIILLIVPWLLILSKTKAYPYVRITGALLAAVAAVGWIVQRISNQSNFIADGVERTAANARWILFALAVVSLLIVARQAFKKPALHKA